MRRLALLTVAALLFLPVWSEAQSCDGCGIGYRPSSLGSSGGTLTGPLLLPNGSANNTSLRFVVSAANYGWFSPDGTSIDWSGGGATRLRLNTAVTIFSDIGTGSSDNYAIGTSTSLWNNAYLTRSIQGSKSKALTGGSATTFTRVAVPQTAGANFGGGSVGYTVYATDATDSQSLVGKLYFAMVNKAGTETCAIGEVGTPVLAQSSGSTLTCTFTCATAAADTVDISANCASGLVETTFTINYRADMQQPNTYTPQ